MKLDNYEKWERGEERPSGEDFCVWVEDGGGNSRKSALVWEEMGARGRKYSTIREFCCRVWDGERSYHSKVIETSCVHLLW